MHYLQSPILNARLTGWSTKPLSDTSNIVNSPKLLDIYTIDWLVNQPLSDTHNTVNSPNLLDLYTIDWLVNQTFVRHPYYC